jgi:hypothetical protein
VLNIRGERMKNNKEIRERKNKKKEKEKRKGKSA